MDAFSPDDTAEPMKNDMLKPEHCDMKDILRFLFPFCGAKADATEVEHKDHGILVALEEVLKRANKRETTLRSELRFA